MIKSISVRIIYECRDVFILQLLVIYWRIYSFIVLLPVNTTERVESSVVINKVIIIITIATQTMGLEIKPSTMICCLKLYSQ